MLWKPNERSALSASNSRPRSLWRARRRPRFGYASRSRCSTAPRLSKPRRRSTGRRWFGKCSVVWPGAQQPDDPLAIVQRIFVGYFRRHGRPAFCRTMAFPGSADHLQLQRSLADPFGALGARSGSGPFAAMAVVAYEAPDDIATDEIALGGLASDWREDIVLTRKLGDGWIKSARTALLRVPSAIVPLPDIPDRNIVINHQHPESQRIRISRVHRHFSFDARLFRRSGQTTS